jgi:hypothetical protein
MPASRPVSRRSLLALATTGVAGSAWASACSLAGTSGEPEGGSRSTPATPTERVTRTAAPVTPEELDLPLAQEMYLACASAEDLVRRTLRRHPDLAPSLRPVAAVHLGHAELLLGALGDATTPGGADPIPARARAAWAVVRRREGALQETLRGAALRAQSGALARALASMSAAVAQQRANLPARAPAVRA